MIRLCDHTLLSRMICPVAKTEAGRSPILSGMWILRSARLGPAAQAERNGICLSCRALQRLFIFNSSYIVITYYYICNRCFQA